MRNLVIGLVVTVLVLFGLLFVIEASNTKQDGEVVGIEEAKANLESITDENNPVATIVLTQNKEDYTFTFELFPEVAPQSVYNFISLGNSGFYDGLTMHRVISSFVMQN